MAQMRSNRFSIREIRGKKPLCALGLRCLYSIRALPTCLPCNIKMSKNTALKRLTQLRLTYVCGNSNKNKRIWHFVPVMALLRTPLPACGRHLAAKWGEEFFEKTFLQRHTRDCREARWPHDCLIEIPCTLGLLP
jgi:hypothetical protein